MTFLNIFITILLQFSPAAEKSEELLFLYQGKIAPIPILKYEGARFNEDCIKSGTNCTALKVYKSKKRKQLASTLGSPSLSYCKSVGATPVILKTKMELEIAFCLFDDISFINAADLYQKHWGKK